MVPRLMLVTDRHDTAGRDLVAVVREAVAGGVEIVQVREKDMSDLDLRLLIERIVEAAEGHARVVVNGRPSVALMLGLGLHLPEADAVPDPRPAFWGRSVHSVEGAMRAAREGPGYLLLGTIFETSSKPGLAGSGLELVRNVVGVRSGVPVLAIGGIDPTNAAGVLRAGAHGIAVRSAILTAADPAEAARELRRVLDRHV